MHNDNQVYLSYKSTCLRISDVKCFQGNNFLNDLCISFYYELLNEKFKSHENDFFLFDPASISTMVIYDEIEEIIDMFGSLNLHLKKYLFMPINNNTDKYSISVGDHWALIIYQKSDDTFYYLDSMLNYIGNTDIVISKMKKVLTNYSQQDSMNSHSFSPTLVKTLNYKFQNNTYDCGMFVLHFTEILMYQLFEESDRADLSKNSINYVLKLKLSNIDTKLKRKQILDIIDGLRLIKK